MYLELVTSLSTAIILSSLRPVLAEKCLYSILGVKPDVSQQKLNQAFHRLSLKHHSDDTQFRRHRNPEFDQITQAFHILSNPLMRQQYDQNPSKFEPSDADDIEVLGTADYSGNSNDDLELPEKEERKVKKSTSVSGGSFTYSHTTHKDGEAPVTHSVTGGFQSGQHCKTVTEKVGNKISTHTTCTSHS